jgi:FkbM family methyltransferase
VTSLKGAVVGSARAAGVDLVRLRGVRHPVGRRARLMTFLGIDLVIDVGANRGHFGLEIRRAGYGGRIVSIEPLATPYGQLSRLAAGDGRWTAIRSAVGPTPGSATIHVAANEGASSSFLPMLNLHARSAPEARYVADERVEVATLDDLVQAQCGDPAAVFTKIDVQGYELQVLAGGEATLARSTLVQLEMSLLPLYDTAPSYREILDFMAQHGFRLVGIEPGFASPTGALLQADGLFATDAATRSLEGF